MLARATAGRASPGRAVDVVGTGGDRAHTVNISTMAAIVVAGAGAPGGQARQPGRVVGLRRRPTCSRSSASRSTCRPRRSPDCVAEVGIGFCFAPVFHPGMRHAGGAAPRAGRPDRVQLPRPADQPGAADRAAAIGCADARMAPVMAEVFAAPRRQSRAGVPRRRRPRRAHHDHAPSRSGWSRTATVRARRVDPTALGPRPWRSPGRPARRRRRDATPRRPRRAGGGGGAGARRGAAQRGGRAGGRGRDRRRRPRRRVRRGAQAGRRRDRLGRRAREVLDRWVAAGQRLPAGT